RGVRVGEVGLDVGDGAPERGQLLDQRRGPAGVGAPRLLDVVRGPGLQQQVGTVGGEPAGDGGADAGAATDPGDDGDGGTHARTLPDRPPSGPPGSGRQRFRPRAATAHRSTGSPPRRTTRSSARLTAAQTWLGATRTTSPRRSGGSP